MSSVFKDELPRDYRKAATFLAMAQALGELGTCDRKYVGAIIIRDGRCISWGYNGAPPGMPHCEENHHGYKGTRRDGWAMTDQEMIESFGCKNVTHAEANAVAFAARQGISTEGASLYVTVSPCEVCARLLIAAGIVHVVFDEEYRDPAGILLLRGAGVKVIG